MAKKNKNVIDMTSAKVISASGYSGYVHHFSFKIFCSKIYHKIKRIIMRKKTILKPCPFCGFEKPKRYRSGDSHYIYCPYCEAQIKKNSISVEEEIVNLQWNQRHKEYNYNDEK